MMITWEEAKALNKKHQIAMQNQADRKAEEDAKAATMTRFPVGSYAQINREFNDPRLWGDTVKITAYCPFDGEPGLCADFQSIDETLIFSPYELAPIIVKEATR